MFFEEIFSSDHQSDSLNIFGFEVFAHSVLGNSNFGGKVFVADKIIINIFQKTRTPPPQITHTS